MTVGRVAVVTGGAGDIGLAVAERLAARERSVVLADVDRAGLEAGVEAIRASGGAATARVVDLSDAASCVDLIESVWRDQGPIGAVVNAAAVTNRGRIDEVPTEAWDRLIAVNLSAVHWVCRATISRLLEASQGGVIVNLASIAAIRGLPGSPLYAATKGGVVALSRALAVDHARDGIRVHAVTPPAIDTKLYRRMFEADPDPEAARSAYEAEQGAGRVLTVPEVAELIGFLCDGTGPIYSPEPLVW